MAVAIGLIYTGNRDERVVGDGEVMAMTLPS
jgi:hypothetical protein